MIKSKSDGDPNHDLPDGTASNNASRRDKSWIERYRRNSIDYSNVVPRLSGSIHEMQNNYLNRKKGTRLKPFNSIFQGG